MAGVYAHIPFCEKKCFYCDFYSLGNSIPDTRFINALTKEIELFFEKRPEAEGFKANSLFFGGGTPTLLTPEQLYKIIEKLRQFIAFEPDFEFTLEANPGSSETDKFREFRGLGVNRLSIGVQSFIPSELKFLQRIHSPEEAEQAVHKARNAGFDNVNLDLIFAVPGQTQETFKYNLSKAAELETDHISVYSLMYEEGTPLYKKWLKGNVTKTSEESDALLFELAQEYLLSKDYHQYEVSNYAKAGKSCRHNLNYWHGEEYLAFGPSAHGHYSGSRYRNVKSLRKYYEALDKSILAYDGIEKVTKKERLEELIFLGLRADGIPLEKIKEESGIRLQDVLKDLFDMLKDKELIIRTNAAVSLTPKGYLLCDEITVRILEALEL